MYQVVQFCDRLRLANGGVSRVGPAAGRSTGAMGVGGTVDRWTWRNNIDRTICSAWAGRLRRLWRFWWAAQIKGTTENCSHRLHTAETQKVTLIDNLVPLSIQVEGILELPEAGVCALQIPGMSEGRSKCTTGFMGPL